ncbi:MAG: cyclic nucleotide-binding domain-containing protein [Leptospira sp.]|nr:cyclic nucleotide-binding domain-containing protein [Leptospira sp.]
MVRDILWLRCLAMVSQVFMVNYGFFKPNFAILSFNSMFLVINTYHVIKLYLERKPIQLPIELDSIYNRTFNSMTTREFLSFWNTGNRTVVSDRRICQSGMPQKDLVFIIEGKAEVTKNGKKIGYLKSGDFIAEMSFLSGESASADVHAIGSMDCNSWSQEKLKNLKQLNPNLYIKIQFILGKDLTHKIISHH